MSAITCILFWACSLHGKDTHLLDLQVLEDTEALFINGFVLDEIPASVVVAAAQQAQRAGAAVFFDPGAHMDSCGTGVQEGWG